MSNEIERLGAGYESMVRVLLEQRSSHSARGGDFPAEGEPETTVIPEYLSVNQTCKFLGISRSKLYYLTNPSHRYFDATFPPWKPVGLRGRKFRRTLLVAWVEGARSEGGTS